MNETLRHLVEPLPPEQRRRLREALAERLTEHRRAVMNQVLEQRTRHVCVVLEDIYQPHNASAVLRSCDGFGIQDVHIIERRYRFQLKKTIALGASKWLTLHRCRLAPDEPSTDYLTGLKRRGFRIVATTLRPGSRPLAELDLSTPIALCFGTEEEGLTDEAHAIADEQVHLLMYGFTQSFNISVTVALCLQLVRERMKEFDIQASLTPEEKDDVLLEWVLASLPHPEAHVERLLPLPD